MARGGVPSPRGAAQGAAACIIVITTPPTKLPRPLRSRGWTRIGRLRSPPGPRGVRCGQCRGSASSPSLSRFDGGRERCCPSNLDGHPCTSSRQAAAASTAQRGIQGAGAGGVGRARNFGVSSSAVVRLNDNLVHQWRRGRGYRPKPRSDTAAAIRRLLIAVIAGTARTRRSSQ